MVTQREYKVISENKECMGDRDNEGKESKCIIAINAAGEKLCAFLTIQKKLNVENFKSYISKLNQIDIQHGIIIYENITPPTKKLINNTNKLRHKIELFLSNELQYNITKHVLVPKHVKLTSEAASKFKQKHGTNFPVLLSTDVVSRFYGFEKGNVIEITRPNGFISYRIVK